MQNQSKSGSGRKLRRVLAGAALLAAGIVTTVVGQGMGGGEITDAGHSWPHEISSTNPACAGKTMAELLTEIHAVARSGYEAASPQNRLHINTILENTLLCLGYDGRVEVPPGHQGPAPHPHHSLFGGQDAHQAARLKVESAWVALKPPPPASPDWAKAAGDLQHGH